MHILHGTFSDQTVGIFDIWFLSLLLLPRSLSLFAILTFVKISINKNSIKVGFLIGMCTAYGFFFCRFLPVNSSNLPFTIRQYECLHLGMAQEHVLLIATFRTDQSRTKVFVYPGWWYCNNICLNYKYIHRHKFGSNERRCVFLKIHFFYSISTQKCMEKYLIFALGWCGEGFSQKNCLFLAFNFRVFHFIRCDTQLSRLNKTKVIELNRMVKPTAK